MTNSLLTTSPYLWYDDGKRIQDVGLVNPQLTKEARGQLRPDLTIANGVQTWYYSERL